LDICQDILDALLPRLHRLRKLSKRTTYRRDAYFKLDVTED